MFGVAVAVIALLVSAVLYGILPLVASIRQGCRNGKVLEAGFPSMYEGFHWLLGHSAFYPGPTEEGLMEYIKKMKTVSNRALLFYVTSWKPTLLLCHPDTVKEIQKTAMPKSSDEAFGYKLYRPWIGDGLIVSTGAKWFRNRRLLTPAFHFDILKPYVTIYNQATENLMKNFEQCAETGRSMDIWESVSMCTFDIILKCAFSSDAAQNDPSYVKAITSKSKLFMERFYNPLLHSDAIYFRTKGGKLFKQCCEKSHEVASRVVKRRREVLAENPDFPLKSTGRYVDFLDVLLLARDTDGMPLSDQEIRDEVETFMFAGHDTTKCSISLALYNLARHPEVQKRLRAEVKSLLDGRDSEEILWEDLSKMPYLTQCIKESLRMYPPAHVQGRKATEDLTIDGKLVPKGTVINFSPWCVHHNSEVWGEDHMTYDPDRFSEDNITKMDSHAFIPFSAGPRNCIGQNFAMNEMKVAVARIINRFELSFDESVAFELVQNIVLGTKNGIWLKFKRI